MPHPRGGDRRRRAAAVVAVVVAATLGASPAAAEDAPPSHTTSVLGLGPSVEVLGRHLRFTDAVGGVRPFDLTASASPGAALEVFPVRWVGIVANATHGVGIRAGAADGTRTGVTLFRARASVRGRLWVRSLELFVDAGGGRSELSLIDPGPDAAGDPSVDYLYLRGALGGRLSLGRFALLASAGAATLRNAGPLGRQLPRGKGGLVDASIGGAWSPKPRFELRATLSYERAFFAFHPLPGDAHVAGGAVDHYEMVHLDAMFYFF